MPALEMDARDDINIDEASLIEASIFIQERLSSHKLHPHKCHDELVTNSPSIDDVMRMKEIVDKLNDMKFNRDSSLRKSDSYNCQQ